MQGERIIRVFGLCVVLCATLFVYSHDVLAKAAAWKNPALAEAEKSLPFAPGQVLFGVKEGRDPRVVLQDAGLVFKSVRRVHSIKPVVAKYKQFLKKKPLEKDREGWYRFRGKRYKDINNIDDNEVFQEALKSMSPPQSTLYRDYKVTFSKDGDVLQVVAQLKKRPDVEYAQPNYLNRLYATPLPNVFYIPNDFYVEDDQIPGYWREASWGQDYPDLWGLHKIQAIEAWNEFADPSQEPGQDVIVAVIDTGVWSDHPDLAGNIFYNENDPVGDANGDGDPDDDGNGLIDDTNGWDFSGDEPVEDPGLIDPDSDPYDQVGHGTHCAGTIAAVGNNSTGLIGVAPHVKILPVKIFPNAYDDITAQAIQYAASFANAPTHVVLSNSWGPSSRLPSNPVIENAIDAAVDVKGCVVVFAAGNENDDVAYYSPANYSKTIAVAASDHNDQRSFWKVYYMPWSIYSASNYGALIDVAAPGGGDPTWAGQGLDAVNDILSTMSDNSDQGQAYPSLQVAPHYYRLGGTSMACPHVAALAALIWSKDPALSHTEVRNTICASSDDVGQPGKDEDSGWGRINAYKALLQEPVSMIEIVEVSPRKVLSPTIGQEFSLTIEITNKWVDATDVNVTLTISDTRF
ncbi:MAG: S8 family serine peptidase, partial [Planctomycetota bacterium]